MLAGRVLVSLPHFVLNGWVWLPGVFLHTEKNTVPRGMVDILKLLVRTRETGRSGVNPLTPLTSTPTSGSEQAR